MKNYKIITRDEYKKKKVFYLKLISDLFKNDNSKIANLEEFTNHLEFIFSDSHQNDAILILDLEDGKIISMVNFFQYNNIDNLWCLFSLFTLNSKRNMGYGKEILKFGIEEVKKRGAKLLISGIEHTNIKSIKLHEEVGFRNSGKTWDELACGFPKNYIGYIMEIKK